MAEFIFNLSLLPIWINEFDVLNLPAACPSVVHTFTIFYMVNGT